MYKRVSMKERITITLDKAIIEKIQARAYDQKRSLSGLINRLLTGALESKCKGVSHERHNYRYVKGRYLLVYEARQQTGVLRQG
jgi:hypothetical protein